MIGAKHCQNKIFVLVTVKHFHKVRINISYALEFTDNECVCIFQLNPRLKTSSELLSLFWRGFLYLHQCPGLDLFKH